MRFIVVVWLLFTWSVQCSANDKQTIMTGPAKNGALIYADDIQSLAKFYATVFSMQVIRETQEFVSLDKNGFNIIIHVPPAKIPEAGFSAVKLFLTIDNLRGTRETVEALGGSALPGEWSNSLFTVANITDPNGNHIQIREFKVQKSVGKN